MRDFYKVTLRIGGEEKEIYFAAPDPMSVFNELQLWVKNRNITEAKFLSVEYAGTVENVFNA